MIRARCRRVWRQLCDAGLSAWLGLQLQFAEVRAAACESAYHHHADEAHRYGQARSRWDRRARALRHARLVVDTSRRVEALLAMRAERGS